MKFSAMLQEARTIRFVLVVIAILLLSAALLRAQQCEMRGRPCVTHTSSASHLSLGGNRLSGVLSESCWYRNRRAHFSLKG